MAWCCHTTSHYLKLYNDPDLGRHMVSPSIDELTNPKQHIVYNLKFPSFEAEAFASESINKILKAFLGHLHRTFKIVLWLNKSFYVIHKTLQLNRSVVYNSHFEFIYRLHSQGKSSLCCPPVVTSNITNKLQVEPSLGALWSYIYSKMAGVRSRPTRVSKPKQSVMKKAWAVPFPQQAISQGQISQDISPISSTPETSIPSADHNPAVTQSVDSWTYWHDLCNYKPWLRNSGNRAKIY